MTHEEFELIKGTEATISVEELTNKNPYRIMLYGYTIERKTFEVFLADDIFELWINQEMVKTSKTLETSECIPDKRVYPEKSDYEFCLLLKAKGVNIPFTVYS